MMLTRSCLRRRVAAVTLLSAVLSVICACAPAPAPVEPAPVAQAPARPADPTANGRSYPGPATTGVPAGTQLTPYDGPCEITQDGTVIEAKEVGCALVVKAADVVVSKSLLRGPVNLDTDATDGQRWSMTVQDSEIDGGTGQIAAIGWGNMTILRSDVHGGQTAVQCLTSARYCTVRDSWLHGQYLPDGADWHLGGFLSNGGSNIELTGNTIACDAVPNAAGGGCTGNINLLPDFAPISEVTIAGNLLRASEGSAYCTYGGDSDSKPFPNADHVVYQRNVFERGSSGRCAAYGPVTSFDRAGRGNVWSGNLWDDGRALPAP